MYHITKKKKKKGPRERLSKDLHKGIQHTYKAGLQYITVK